jgi:hypothetical protein
MARKSPLPPDLVSNADGDGSTVRPRAGQVSTQPRQDTRPRQESSSELKSGAASTRRHSSTRPAAGSLDDRLEKKMRLAGELMKDLPPSDARVRLLYVAIMRRDEALLDGVLSELNKHPVTR